MEHHPTTNYNHYTKKNFCILCQDGKITIPFRSITGIAITDKDSAKWVIVISFARMTLCNSEGVLQETTRVCLQHVAGQSYEMLHDRYEKIKKAFVSNSANILV